MSKNEVAKRYLLFVISLFFAALSVAITKHGELGASPISSVTNVMSCKFTALSLGNWLIIWNCFLILGQVVLLKKIQADSALAAAFVIPFRLVHRFRNAVRFIYSRQFLSRSAHSCNLRNSCSRFRCCAFGHCQCYNEFE